MELGYQGPRVAKTPIRISPKALQLKNILIGIGDGVVPAATISHQNTNITLT